MIHGSETWPVWKENKVALIPSKELRETERD